MTKMDYKNGIMNEEEVVKPVRMSISVDTIPHYFDRDTLCSMDIIAYVRRKDRCPDPRVPIILDADCAPFDKEILSGNKIFWGGPSGNEGEVSLFSGLSSWAVSFCCRFFHVLSVALPHWAFYNNIIQGL